MTKEHSPAFQFYAKDWLASTSRMTAAERGAYINLLATEWLDGGLPMDRERLRRIAGAEVGEWDSIADVVLAKFTSRDGHLVNARLESVRTEKEEYFRAKSRAGKASARTRRQQSRNRVATELEQSGNTTPPDGEHNVNSGANTLATKSNSASASPSASPPPPTSSSAGGGRGGGKSELGRAILRQLTANGIRGSAPLAGLLVEQLDGLGQVLQLIDEAQRQSNRDDWRGQFVQWVRAGDARSVLEAAPAGGTPLPNGASEDWTGRGGADD